MVSSGVTVGMLTCSSMCPFSSPMARTIFVPPPSSDPSLMLRSPAALAAPFLIISCRKEYHLRTICPAQFPGFRQIPFTRIFRGLCLVRPGNYCHYSRLLPLFAESFRPPLRHTLHRCYICAVPIQRIITLYAIQTAHASQTVSTSQRDHISQTVPTSQTAHAVRTSGMSTRADRSSRTK